MDNPAFEENFFNGIGKLTYYFSQMEHGLSTLVSAILKTDFETGEIISCRQNISKLMEIVDGLFRHVINEKELTDKYDTWRKKVKRCTDQRNKIIHSLWDVYNPEIKYRTKNKIELGKGFKRDWEPINIEEIYETAELAKSASLDTIGLIAEMELKRT